MQNYSILILTKNEEKNIATLLQNIKGMGTEVIVIDDISSDKTVLIAEKCGAIVYKHALHGDFAAQRNWGMKKAKNNWILFLDADEIPSTQMKEYISKIPEQTAYNAFCFKRIDSFWGKELHYGEVANTKVTRFIQKETGQFIRPVHEMWQGTKVHTVNVSLLHYPHPTIISFIKSVNYYSTLNAQHMKQQNRKTNILSICLFPLGKFIYTYCIKLGFLDGAQGFVYSFMMSFHSFLTRAKIYTTA